MENKKPKLLLVDDDNFLLDMYSVKFAKSGLEVNAVCGSEQALKKLREGFQPDILVLDIVMPTIDGLEMLSAIRKESLAKNTTVIMLTNQSQSSDIERAKQLGVAGYIIKATTIPSEVLEKVMDIYKKNRKK